MELTVFPPTSDMCPNIEAQPTTRPPKNTGITTSQSLAWLMAPSQEYGSEVSSTSPSSTVPSNRPSSAGIDSPNCPTTILPAGSAISGNSSCCSRMPGDSAVRKSTSSISYRALRSPFSIRSRVTGSTAPFSIGPVDVSMIRAMGSRLRVDQQGARRVHGGRVPGEDEGGGVHLGDDRRTAHHVAGAEPGPVVDAGGHVLAADVDGVLLHPGARRVAVAGLQVHRCDVRPRPGDRGPGVGDLVVDVQQEGEQPVVLGVEALPQGLQVGVRVVDVDRDLEALPVVPDVDLVADGLLLARQALLGQPPPR